RDVPALRRPPSCDCQHRGARNDRADSRAPRPGRRAGRSGVSEPCAAPGRALVLTALHCRAAAPGTGGSWLAAGCASISRWNAKSRPTNRARSGRLGADVGARRTAPPGSTAPRQLTYGPLYALSARPQQGTILLGGLDMQQIAEDALRAHIGYLPQDYRLVQGTLRDNLLLGLSQVDDDVLMTCAERTGLAPFIAAHPKGLDMPISEGGGGVSGGQRQLVGLTRLLLAEPKLWLLDEPTAALDQDAENRVLRAIESAVGKDGTLVLVTHKLSLMKLVQRVIVIGYGRVVLDGPTAKVLKELRVAAMTGGKTQTAPVVAVDGA